MKKGVSEQGWRRLASLSNYSKVSQEYQGWSNYETWAVALYMDSDRGIYKYVMERANELKSDPDGWMVLADNLKELYEEQMPELEGAFGQLLSGAFSQVNWDEIAKNFMENL